MIDWWVAGKYIYCKSKFNLLLTIKEVNLDLSRFDDIKTTHLCFKINLSKSLEFEKELNVLTRLQEKCVTINN